VGGLLELHAVEKTVVTPDGTDLEILRGISLTVQQGESVSIVGRSGSGKSTLLNVIGMIDTPTGGEVLYDGSPTSQLRGGQRDRLRGSYVGFVFQQFNLLQGRTALENAMMPLMYERSDAFWDRERIATEMLERVGLGERLDVTPDRLSGGEQQRVAIARALVRHPRLILADEPTGALDLETGDSVMTLLEEEAAQSGAALITITHDPAIAARGHSTYRLDRGVLTHTGSGRPAHMTEPAGSTVVLSHNGAPVHANHTLPTEVIPVANEAGVQP